MMRHASTALLGAVLFTSGMAAGLLRGQEDCNHNGLSDPAEVGDGLTPDCNENGIPDECDVEVREFGLAMHADLVLDPLGGEVPVRVVSGDFNEDGRPDLICASYNMPFLVENLGEEGFSKGKRLYAGTEWLQGITVADINGDQHLDLASVGCGFLCHEPMVSFLLGDGKGGFGLAKGIGLGDMTELDGVAAADFDGDGRADIAVSVEGQIRLYSRAGEEEFVERAVLPVGGRIAGAPDIDGDGDPDIATSIAVFRNQGNWEFVPAYVTDHLDTQISVTVHDLDGDGDLDMAALEGGGSDPIVLWIIENKGASGFQKLVGYQLHENASKIAAGDFDGDGRADLVTTNGLFGEAGSVYLFLNKGELLFTQPLEYDGPAEVKDAIAADLDGDGRPDLASVTSGTASLAIHLNRPLATSSDCNRNGVPDTCEMDIVDCDRNGVPDTCDVLQGTARDCNRNGIPDSCDVRSSLDFGPAARYQQLVGPSWIAIGDVNGDGHADLAVANHRMIGGDVIVSGHTVSLLLGDGSGKFQGSEMDVIPGVELEQWEPNGLALGDLDGDGDLDLAVAYGEVEENREISVYINRGDAQFEEPVIYRGAGWAVAAADLDSDGDLDLVTPRSVFRNAGDGSFAAAPEIPVGSVPLEIRARLFPHQAAGDLDGDGDVDLVEIDQDLFDLRLEINQGAGGDGEPVFAPPIRLEGGLRPWAVTLADIDGNGDLDIAATFRNSGEVAVFMNGGKADFAPPARFAAPSRPTFVAQGDLDADGLPDLVTAEWNGSHLSVLLNRTLPPASKDQDNDGIPDGCSPALFHRGDSNGDGSLDISDPVHLLGWLFLGKAAPACLEAGDCDNDGKINLSDAVHALLHLFQGGPPPAPPGPPPSACGPDPDAPGSAGDLGCNSYPRC